MARDAGSDGRRLGLVLLPANDAALVIDADRGSLLRWIRLGVLPLSAALSHDGGVAWIANFGGGQPTAAERAVLQCCLRRAEKVRVDPRGVATGGSVVRVDVLSGRATSTISVGRHANGLAWDETHERLYVDERRGRCRHRDRHSLRARALDGEGGAVPRTDRRARADGARPLARATALRRHSAARTRSPCMRYAARRNASLLGLIPTAWYPSSDRRERRRKAHRRRSLFGVGAGEGIAGGACSGRYVLRRARIGQRDRRADRRALAAYTTAVAENNRLTRVSRDRGAGERSPARRRAARPVPERPGEPSPIKHVVFIIRENRTYDQVLGDLDRGARDSSLVMYGRDVTPNAHALAERFVTLDHFFASGGNSADGHQWLTQANETEYPMWPLYYGRSYPSEGEDALAYSSGGFLWEARAGEGKDASPCSASTRRRSKSRSRQRSRGACSRSTASRSDTIPHFIATMLKAALQHALGHSVARSRARARVSRVDAGSAGRREGRRHPRAPRAIGKQRARCRIS